MEGTMNKDINIDSVGVTSQMTINYVKNIRKEEVKAEVTKLTYEYIREIVKTQFDKGMITDVVDNNDQEWEYLLGNGVKWMPVPKKTRGETMRNIHSFFRVMTNRKLSEFVNGVKEMLEENDI